MKKQWVMGAMGLLLAGGLGIATQPQATAAASKQYVTVSAKHYTIWRDTKFKQAAKKTDSVYHKTFASTSSFKSGGSTYYRLTDTKGKAVGYLNSRATKVGSGAQGAAFTTNRYVTFTNKNYTVYTGFSWHKKLAGSSANQHTYLAKTTYYHNNGSTYLSLYDGKNKQVGMVNVKAVKYASGSQGVMQGIAKKNVYATSRNGSYWRGFNFKTSTKGHSYYSTQLVAKGIYHHINGSNYYSVYRTNGQWVGFVNTTLVKSGTVGNRVVYITGSGKGVAYHFNNHCSALSRSHVVKTTLKKALASHLHLCKLEY